MKYGMFESYMEALCFLAAGAAVTGVIVYGIVWIIWGLI